MRRISKAYKNLSEGVKWDMKMWSSPQELSITEMLGFIGSNLVGAILNLGHEVIGLNNHLNRKEDIS